MSVRIRLATELSRWFEQNDLAQLPPRLQDLIDRHYSLVKWTDLAPWQRRIHAEHVDQQHPSNLVDEQIAERQFLGGYKRVSVPRRNKSNAKKPRLSRQRVEDSEILRIRKELTAQGIPRHKMVSTAFGRLFGKAPSMSLRSFRDRWNRLLPKKGG